jgi:hypothetical protein
MFGWSMAATDTIGKTAPTVQHVLVGWETYLKAVSNQAFAGSPSQTLAMLEAQETYNEVIAYMAKHEIMGANAKEIANPSFGTKFQSLFSPVLRRAIVISAFMEEMAHEHFLNVTKAQLPNAQTAAPTP